MDTPIVARARSRGGSCGYCGRHVTPGDEVVKLDVGLRGAQTAHGNGRGLWACLPCAARLVGVDQL